MKNLIFKNMAQPLSAAMALPLALWCGILTLGYKVPIEAVVSALTFRIFYAALLALVISRAIFLFRDREQGKALLCLGVSLLMLQAAYSYGWRFSAMAGIGEGEAFLQFDSVRAGPWAKREKIPFVLRSAGENRDEKAVILTGGNEHRVGIGETINWKGYHIRYTGTHRAPLFVIRNARGEELEGLYFRTAFPPDNQESIEFRFLPHRFYVSDPEGPRTAWVQEGDSWKPVQRPGKSPTAGSKDALYVRIIRGKLMLFDGMAKKGQDIPFDAYLFRFEDGAFWSQFEVIKAVPLFFLYSGIGSLGLGIALVLRRRIQ